MSDDNGNMVSRRQWLKAVAATAVGATAAGAILTSCRHGEDGITSLRANASGEEKDPFDADEIIANLPDEVHCVGCSRCMPCQYGVHIPAMYAAYNEAVKSGEIPRDGKDFHNGGGTERSRGFVARIEREIGDKHIAHRCAGCGGCEYECPMGLPIASHMRSIGRFIDLTREIV